jgi:hypothetical protein
VVSLDGPAIGRHPGLPGFIGHQDLLGIIPEQIVLVAAAFEQYGGQLGDPPVTLDPGQESCDDGNPSQGDRLVIA